MRHLAYSNNEQYYPQREVLIFTWFLTFKVNGLLTAFLSLSNVWLSRFTSSHRSNSLYFFKICMSCIELTFDSVDSV